MKAAILRTVLRDLVGGLQYRYPLCCVLVYVWDTLRGRPSAFQRGHAATHSGVPCGIFHKTARPFENPDNVVGVIYPDGRVWTNPRYRR